MSYVTIEKVGTYRLQICHQMPGEMVALKEIVTDTPPPFYPEGTSVEVDGVCYRVMETLVSVADHLLQNHVTITHQVRLK